MKKSRTNCVGNGSVPYSIFVLPFHFFSALPANSVIVAAGGT